MRRAARFGAFEKVAHRSHADMRSSRVNAFDLGDEPDVALLDCGKYV